MIVVDEGEWLRIVTQPDHASLAAELLSLWRVDGMPVHPRRHALLAAVREHDNGWQEADSAPAVDPETLRPHDFLTCPPTVRRDIWKRGIERHASRDPYTALLIAKHAATIHRPLDPLLGELLQDLEPKRQEWRDRVGLDRRTLREDYRWLELADALSLTVCTRSPDWSSALGFDTEIDGDTLFIGPFPLAGTTTLRLAVRRIPNRPYERDTALASALARALWIDLPVRVASI